MRVAPTRMMTMRSTLGVVLAFVFPLFACSGSSSGGVGDAPVDAGGGDDAATTPAPAGDAGSDAQPDVPATQTVKLASCNGLNGVAEACTIVFDASACTSAKCKKLVVVFSGG